MQVITLIPNLINIKANCLIIILNLLDESIIRDNKKGFNDYE